MKLLKHWKVVFKRGASGTSFMLVNAYDSEEVRKLASWHAYVNHWRKWAVESITEIEERSFKR